MTWINLLNLPSAEVSTFTSLYQADIEAVPQGQELSGTDSVRSEF